MPTLGRQLLRALEDVTRLIPQATSPEDLEQIRRLRARLIEQIGALVEANLHQGSREYRAATSGLQDASGSIHRAMGGMERVATAVETLGKALDLVAGLAAG